MGELWVDAYAPRRVEELAGNQELTKEAITWLANWRIGLSSPLLLHGPPGCGKTTTVALIAKACNRDVVELNASDTRSASSLRRYVDEFASYTGSNFCPRPLLLNQSSTAIASTRSKILVLEEVDGLDGNSDRGGIKTMVDLASRCTLPVVFTANLEPKAQKMAPIARLCKTNVLQFRPLTERQMRSHINRLVYLATGHVPDAKLIDGLVQTCHGDLRQLINEAQIRLDRTIKPHRPPPSAVARIPISQNEVVAARANPFERARELLTDKASMDQRIEDAFENRYLTHCMIFGNYPNQFLPRNSKQHRANLANMFSVADQFERAVSAHHQHALELANVVLGTVLPASACEGSSEDGGNPHITFPNEVMGGNSKWLAGVRTGRMLRKASALTAHFASLDTETCKVLYLKIQRLLELGKMSEALLTIAEPYGIHPDLWVRFVSMVNWNPLGPPKRLSSEEEKKEKERASRERAFLAFCRKSWGATDASKLEQEDNDDGSDKEQDASETGPDPLLKRGMSLSALLAKRKRA